MPTEPDVFKKLDALLNKHRNGEPTSSGNNTSSEDAIPTLTDEIDGDETFPVLTEIFATDVDAMGNEELELDLAFIPEDMPDEKPEPALSAELPDVWEQNEDQFDAETTHGFGLSAFSREAADSVVQPSESASFDNDFCEVPVPDDAATALEQAADYTAQTADLNELDFPDSMFGQAEESETGLNQNLTSQFSSDTQAHAGTAEREIFEQGQDDARAESIAREFAFNDALAERAMRDLDRHVAAILEYKVGPQLAHRLDQALASMLDQFSTNIESLIRDAVRDEMRRYFDDNRQ